jgi:hypothetical protein
MKIHSSITIERVIEAIEADHYAGFCIICGEESGSVEPDAREYLCASCDERAVYGAEELLVTGMIS